MPTDSTPATPQQTASTIGTIITDASVIASIAFPQYAALVAMATALAHVAPEIYVDVMLLLAKKEPTQADYDAVHAKLSVLADPTKLYA